MDRPLAGTSRPTLDLLHAVDNSAHSYDEHVRTRIQSVDLLAYAFEFRGAQFFTSPLQIEKNVPKIRFHASRASGNGPPCHPELVEGSASHSRLVSSVIPSLSREAPLSHGSHPLSSRACRGKRLSLTARILCHPELVEGSASQSRLASSVIPSLSREAPLSHGSHPLSSRACRGKRLSVMARILNILCPLAFQECYS
jgi:hypothetical protein